MGKCVQKTDSRKCTFSCRYCNNANQQRKAANIYTQHIAFYTVTQNEKKKLVVETFRYAYVCKLCSFSYTYN